MKIEREIHRIVAAAPYLCGVLFTLLLTPALAYVLVRAIAWCVHTGFSWLCTNPRTKHFTTLFIAWWWSETLSKIIKAWNGSFILDALMMAIVLLIVTWIYHVASKSSDSAKSKD